MTQISTRLTDIQSRITTLQEKSFEVLSLETQDQYSPHYFITLTGMLTDLESELERLSSSAEAINVPQIVENYLAKNNQLLLNDRQIEALSRGMQKQVKIFEQVATREEPFTIVYAALGLIGVLVCYLLWRFRKAEKRHEF